MIFVLGLGLVPFIAILIASLFIPRNSKAWPFIMWGCLALDLLAGSFLFAALQGGLLIWYYSRKRQLAAQNKPQVCTNCHKPFDQHAVTGSGIYCPPAS